MQSLSVTWMKLLDGRFPRLRNVDTSAVNVSGVYIIWQEGLVDQVIRVGQGQGTSGIGGRLMAHRNDPNIMLYDKLGSQLFTSWAAIPTPYIDGVERYLANLLNPVVGDRFPDAAPIPVNLPIELDFFQDTLGSALLGRAR